MTEHRISSELDRVLDAQPFGEIDPAHVLRNGRRARRRRNARMSLAASGVAVIVAVVVTTQLTGSSPTGPSAAFEDPGSRVALVAAGGPRDGYPDLVVDRGGGAWVTITGFGWPLQGMDTVSDGEGRVSFPEISKADAETMCLPMLNQAAPEVPDASWRHSEGWIDDFPSRAGLAATYEADFSGTHYYATCTLPGDFSPPQRPDLSRVPASDADGMILRQCGYQGHIDFSGWNVGAADRAEDTVSAALVSPEGFVTRCVLSSAEGQRVTQLSSTPMSEASIDTPIFFGGEGSSTLTLAGVAPPGTTELEITTEGAVRRVPVRHGVYAAVVPVSGRVPADDTVVRALDDDGAEQTIARAVADEPPHEMLLPVTCFTTTETGQDGC